MSRVGRYQPTGGGTGPLGAGDNLFDGRHAQSLVPDREPPHNLITAEEYFRRYGGSVTAFTFDQTLVFLGPAFFSGDSRRDSYDRTIILIHESAHLAG